MNAVRHDGFMTQNSSIGQAIDDSFVVFVERIVLVNFMFGNVNVKAGIQVLLRRQRNRLRFRH